jgi:glycosyltransferase involved in cell wall biosynthesis
MKLEIILRTHDRGNVHKDWRERFFKGSKSDLILGCLQSLINSCKQVKGHEIKIKVLDDNSTSETVRAINNKLYDSGIPYSFVGLVGKGYNYSAHQQFLECRDSKADIVYSVEDDYLHHPNAIREMLDSYILFKSKLPEKEILMYPYDTPEEYNPPNRMDIIVHGSARHWRTGVYTTNVMMTSPQLFKDHWERFETLATKYNGNYLEPRTEHYDEGNTIWPIWSNGINGLATRFNPIPSLALHMQFNEQIDPFIDWEDWWSKYTK